MKIVIEKIAERMFLATIPDLAVAISAPSLPQLGKTLGDMIGELDSFMPSIPSSENLRKSGRV